MQRSNAAVGVEALWIAIAGQRKDQGGRFQENNSDRVCNPW